MKNIQVKIIENRQRIQTFFRYIFQFFRSISKNSIQEKNMKIHTVIIVTRMESDIQIGAKTFSAIMLRMFIFSIPAIFKSSSRYNTGTTEIAHAMTHARNLLE
jgi:hypothetical protein